MIAGLDSSFDRPTTAQIAQAWQAGVRVWGGYLATRSSVNLASPWDKASFDVAHTLGSKPLAFCSGLDDPVACRALAAQWNVRLCLDVEPGIRGDGPWVQAWLDASGAGLYGLCSVHQGRQAAFHVVALYLGSDPGQTWPGSCGLPSGPVAWQWQGSHQEFGLEVDRGWYDDWFGGIPVDQATFNTLMEGYMNGTTAGNALAWRVEALLANRVAVAAGVAAGELNQLKAKLDSLPAAGGLTAAQAQALQEAHDAILRIETALKSA